MPPRKVYFENIRVGDELPALAKAPVDRVQLARYAGATEDFNPIHVDEIFARGLGVPSVYAPSMLGMGFLGQLVTDWARGAQLKRINVKFIKIIWPLDTVVCKGRITDRHGDQGEYLIDLDVWAENQKGELVLKGTAALKVFFNPDDELRQKSGQGPLIVQVPRESILVQKHEPAKAGAAAAKGAPPAKAKTAAAPVKAKAAPAKKAKKR